MKLCIELWIIKLDPTTTGHFEPKLWNGWAFMAGRPWLQRRPIRFCAWTHTSEGICFLRRTDCSLSQRSVWQPSGRSSASVPLTDLGVRNQTLCRFAGGHWCGLKGLITAVILWTDLHTIIVVTVLQDGFGSLCLCECWFVSCQRSSVCCVAVVLLVRQLNNWSTFCGPVTSKSFLE